VSGQAPKLRVGQTIDDRCRPCKMLRRHTVIAVSTDVVRVHCDTCGSQHNYRHGAAGERAPLPAVGERELLARRPPRITQGAAEPDEAEARSRPDAHEEVDVDVETLERLLRRVMREETGLTPVAPAEKWRGGQLVLKPGRDGVQDKTWPIETFFHKIVMLRNRLRVLEQQINAAGFPEDEKVKLQGYITACYGTLTSFNILFADEADRFRGAAGGD